MIHLLQKPLLGVPVNWSHPLARGLVGCWLMNEGSGKSIYDLSRNQNNGVFSAGTPTWTPGKFGPSVNFPNASTINCGGAAGVLNLSTPFSVRATYKATSITGWNMICQKGSTLTAATNSFLLASSTTSLRFYVTDGVSWYYSAYTIAINNWYDVVGVWDGAKTYLYVNGILQDSDAAAITLLTQPTYAFNIGGINTYFLTGIVDSVEVWNRALSAAEIAQLYREPFAMFDRPSIGLLYVVPPAGGQTILDYERSHRGAARGVLVGVS
jgi:hypothetical protein